MALSTNVVGYWKLDESSGNAADSSGNSNTLTNNNTVTYSAGKINNGADLEASSSQSFSIADGSQTGLDLSGDCSFAGWVKFESFTTENTLFAKTDSSTARSYVVRILSSGDGYLMNAECYGDGTTSNRRGANSNAAFTTTTGTWYHFAATFDVDTGTWVFYKDGSVIASTASNAGTVTSIYNSSNKFQMGANNSSGTDDRFFDGMMDEMGVWSRTLTAVEVSQLYNSGSGQQYPFTTPTSQISFDATSIYSSTLGHLGGSSSATATWAHTTTGSNRVLVVALGLQGGAGSDFTSVTYAGVSMTLVRTLTTVAIYYLVNPTLGTNNIVATVNDTGFKPFAGMATSYTGVAQVDPIDSSNSNALSSRTTCNSDTTIFSSNCWEIMIAGGTANNNDTTAGADTTKRQSVYGNGNTDTFFLGDSNGPVLNGTGKTLNAVADASTAWNAINIALVPASSLTLSVKSGTYTGDGSTTKAITGLGFQPKVVIIMATSGTGDASGALYKTADMSTGATGVTVGMGENGQLSTGQIDSLDADGFTVRDQKNINATNYYYLALGGTGCKTSTYVGNGSDNRAITGVGFTPKWVVIQGNVVQHAVHKSRATGMETDNTQWFSAVADSTDRIQKLDNDGFTIGTNVDVNNNTATYYYFAVAGDNVTSSTYTGNGSDSRNITGVGFTPTAVMTKITSATQAGFRTGEAGDLTSLMRANTAPIADAIQSLSSDTFQIGTNAVVNTNTSTYYWVAFYSTASSGPTNLKSLDTNVKANIKSYNTNLIANVKSINTNA